MLDGVAMGKCVAKWSLDVADLASSRQRAQGELTLVSEGAGGVDLGFSRGVFMTNMQTGEHFDTRDCAVRCVAHVQGSAERPDRVQRRKTAAMTNLQI